MTSGNVLLIRLEWILHLANVCLLFAQFSFLRLWSLDFRKPSLQSIPFTLRLDPAAARGSTTSCEPKTWTKFGEVTIVQAARNFVVPTAHTGVFVVLFVDLAVDARNGSDPWNFQEPSATLQMHSGPPATHAEVGFILWSRLVLTASRGRQWRWRGW